MQTFSAAHANADDRIPCGKFMTKKQKKTILRAKRDRYATYKNKVKTLQTLQQNAVKLYIFSTQLSNLIDAIPDAILLKDREGRKLITDKLTKRLFKLHDLDWYGKKDITPALAPQEMHINHEYCRASLESDLHLALAKRQLKLYYQILVGSDRQMLGAEALLRWEHPRYGLITPDQFIPIAEQSGLILPIGAWVLQSACEQLKLWQSDPLKKDLPLAVNISSRQFSRPEFVEQLRQILKETGVNAEQLKLELTESLMLHDIANTIEKMERLKLLGIQFSMDNFGTGYSSLSHLKKLPIDLLKIDQFLMRDIAIDSCDAMIVKTIIDMANKLGVGLIAGGVETEQQFACLKQFGCSTYQGYLFGKPMPADEFEKLVGNSRK
ncbi:MAG: EAL domain-containing protein [Methylococcaceae bacterium]